MELRHGTFETSVFADYVAISVSGCWTLIELIWLVCFHLLIPLGKLGHVTRRGGDQLQLCVGQGGYRGYMETSEVSVSNIHLFFRICIDHHFFTGTLIRLFD